MMFKHKIFVFITIFSLSIFFITFHTLQADDTNLISDIQTVRAKYGDYISHEQAAKILDTVAWNHKSEGWGLLNKPSGNNCPLGSVPISCDFLFNKNSGNGYDIFGSGPGICNGISAAGHATARFSLAGSEDITRWIAPIDPASLPDGMGSDVVLPDNTPGCGPSNNSDNGFSAQPVFNPPTQGLPTDLGQLIQQIFMWSLSILGISVFIMFFYSGFLWLTAAGNTSKIGEAKTHMTNAVFGAILLLSSYLILYTINPDFVENTVNLPGLKTTK